MNQIKTLNELDKAAQSKRAIVVPGTVWKRTPAAIIMHLQGTLILDLIRKGMFIYKSKKEKKQLWKQQN